MGTKFTTKSIVAIGLGAAVFWVLFTYVKVPSPIPETNLQVAYAISVFFAALFGPLAGFLVAFVGHALSDFISYGSPWWSWVVASGVSALIAGFCYSKVAPKVEEGVFGKNEMISFALFAVVGTAVAWLLVAPVLDIVMYSEPGNVVFAQGAIAFVMDALISVILGGALLKAYAATKTGQGSLSKEK